MKLRLGHQARRVSMLVAASGLMMSTMVATVALSPGTASAAHRPICAGTTDSPGILSGTFRSGVRIEGVCTVNGGSAVVHGQLIITKGSALVASFALNDLSGHGTSHLTVLGNVFIGNGASLIMGCEPEAFPCADDPNPDAPTLSSIDTVKGDITENAPLGVIIHAASISGNVHEKSGGGGENCDVPETGVFALFGSPVYSDFEDTTIHGDVTINNVHSCWMGFIRNDVSGTVTILSNKLADPDAIEIETNQISGDLTCAKNSMAWDSSETGPDLFPRDPSPNTVNGTRSGQCLLSSPTEDGGPPGPGPF